MNNITHNDFIGVYHNAFSDSFCQRAIKYFETVRQAGLTATRQQVNPQHNRLEKHDDTLIIPDEETMSLEGSKELTKQFLDIFWKECYAKYVEEFSILTYYDSHKIANYKIQCTPIGGGYHLWHCEHGNIASNNRILAWMLYLNDVEEGGETEFIYQRLRIKPTAGTMLVWPAGFTHVHRGNPPYSNSKYIITGWVEFS